MSDWRYCSDYIKLIRSKTSDTDAWESKVVDDLLFCIDELQAEVKNERELKNKWQDAGAQDLEVINKLRESIHIAIELIEELADGYKSSIYTIYSNMDKEYLVNEAIVNNETLKRVDRILGEIKGVKNDPI